MLAWLYYWLDLNGADGRPSHSKILSSVTQVAFLVAFVGLAFRIPDVSMAFVGLTFVLGSAVYGMQGLKLVLKLRQGNPSP